MSEINKQMLEKIIKKVILEHMGQTQEEFIKYSDKSGVISIKGDTVKPEKFDTGKEGDEVYLKDVLSIEESPRLGCGIMEMKESSFDWTLKYDEIDYVIDGTLEIVIDDIKVVGKKGDIILIPKNTTIKFSTPNSCRFMYVVYPANWQEQ
ncbi:cupin domain-containing protein [Paramaledivibacter caminithermalis]|jgi:ethanolamine utilization protein EutQ|uniref:Ethanolamine utilization protein EutQ n=1 Tax=Paramaledivibacter caminithermalis (strain DSM 15212 / CIP 107654 / DViRD3) TaxID=1121301 RepID=A0A1M6PMY5_PARC5|nr:cupin domain-containing protein [Paramaledivibacter caminithermalis]SHK09315.1 ethanolamine utilization protein EutQ [Paramaledivibacter caminithermalis DSM 15212]